MPLGGRGWDVAETLPKFAEMVREAGREPEDMDITVFAIAPTADEISKYRDAGINRVTLTLSSDASRDEALSTLDDYARLAGL